MDIGTGRHREHMPPLFKDSGEVPLSCNLAALLESIENAKIDRKCPFPAISEALSFKISRKSMPKDPLVGLHRFTS